MKKLLCAVMAMAMLLAMMVPAMAEGDQIVIGSIGPLTGDTADYGKACLAGAQMYLDELNAAGGLLGKQVVLSAKDSKGDATEATLAYSSLKNEGMTALFGPVLSGESAAVAELANADSIPMITPSGTAYSITDAGEYIFRGCFLDPFQAEMLAQYAIVSQGAKKVAVLYDNGNDYSIGLYQSFVKKAEELGAEVVAVETAKHGSDDYTPQLTKIADAEPEFVLAAYYYDSVALILRNAVDVGLEAKFLGADGWSDVPGQVQDDLSLLDNCIYTSGFSSEDDSEVTQSFIAAYKAANNGADPGMFNALGYDTMRILCSAIEAAGSTDAALVKDALKATNLTCVTGTITFDSHNDPVKSAYITGFVDGQAKLLERVDPQ